MTLDEPVRRYLAHALRGEADRGRGVRLTMKGRRVVAQRWGDAGRKQFGHIPCGCEVHAERRFGDVVVPSEVSVGWWFGTPRYAPFFEAEVLTLEAA
jgi:hypothetical protein